MVAENHILALKGPPGSGGRLPTAVAGSVLARIEKLIAGSVRMGFRHSSQPPGRPPEWLRKACDVRFCGMDSEGEETTLLTFEAPRFGDVADEVYHQGQLFESPPSQDDTGFDLLGDMLDHVANRVVDSERFDSQLLERLRGFGRPMKRGIESIAVRGHRLRDRNPPKITKRITEIAMSLRETTPAESRVRVAGKLDMIRASDNVFELILDPGQRVRGVWVGGESSVLGDLWERQVVIDGSAVFRPSGSLLRVDAEGMKEASDGDRFFSKLPTPTHRRANLAGLRKSQTASTGANAVYGQWPGDESEEEILAALKELD